MARAEVDPCAALHEALLSPEGMSTARSALLQVHSWFLHASRVDAFEAIKGSGLEPRNPGCAAPELVRQRLGEGADAIVCLRPMGTLDTTPNRGDHQFLMAIAGDCLPSRIGLDWSFDGCWNLACIVKHDLPVKSDDEVFCDVIRRRGSVVSYEPIPSGALRVWAKGTPEDNPAQWPKLEDTNQNDAEVLS